MSWPRLRSNSATTTTIMSSSSVWVQLYYKGKDEPEGQRVEIEPIPKSVSALVKVTKSELSPDIDHIPPSRIFVYPPGTKPPFSQDKALRSWDQVPSTSSGPSGPNPLIVVAPLPKQANGKKCLDVFRVSCFVRFLLNLFDLSLLTINLPLPRRRAC